MSGGDHDRPELSGECIDDLVRGVLGEWVSLFSFVSIVRILPAGSPKRGSFLMCISLMPASTGVGCGTCGALSITSEILYCVAGSLCQRWKIDLQTDVNLAIDEPAQAHVGMQSTSHPTPPNLVPMSSKRELASEQPCAFCLHVFACSCRTITGEWESSRWEGSGQPLTVRAGRMVINVVRLAGQ